MGVLLGLMLTHARSLKGERAYDVTVVTVLISYANRYFICALTLLIVDYLYILKI
jgi:hypothetical protein